MKEDEIKQGIQLICDTSKEMSRYYNNKSALIEKLNSLSKEDLAPLKKELERNSGPVLDLRMEVLEYLLEGKKLDEQIFDSLISEHRNRNPNSFRSFTEFLIFEQFIAFNKRKQISKFIEQLKDEIVERLELKTKVNYKYIDFQGRPHQGIEQFWLAIYNSKQEYRYARVQLFVEFQDCKIKYGIRRRDQSDKLYRVHGLKEKDSSNFDFEALISLFEKNKEPVLKDEPETGFKDEPKVKPKDETSIISLAGKRLYKISHGSFKAKKDESILDTLKQNHWIVLHENTKKDHTERFKSELQIGDYLYITIGGDELFEIAKVKSDSWKYVPENIIDESDWIYREVEYVKSAIKTNPYELKDQRKPFYPSANSTLIEITPENLNEANENLFKPYFGVEFVSGKIITEALPKFPCNIILYGPPGTGKTYNTIDLAVEIITGNSSTHPENKKVFDALREEGQIEFITFHQNYSYEDFMIGIRPDLDEVSTLKFTRKEGIFYKMCKRAELNYLQSQNQKEIPLNRYVLIIDEINRANISKVFGELITLLEEDKRLGAKNELRISIPGEETGFGIPPNVYVIGTMNTADKSIAMIDIALRRRFEFIGYFPDYNKVDELSGDILRHINKEIYNRKKSADYLIGHGYFMNGGETPETSKVLQNKVIPLLMEYFSGKTEVVEEIFKESEWSVKYDTEKYCWQIKK